MNLCFIYGNHSFQILSDAGRLNILQFNVCEAKFSGGEFVIDKDYSLKLRNKIMAFKAATNTPKALVLTMITTFGVKRNQYSGNVKQEVVLDDLFVG